MYDENDNFEYERSQQATNEIIAGLRNDQEHQRQLDDFCAQMHPSF